MTGGHYEKYNFMAVRGCGPNAGSGGWLERADDIDDQHHANHRFDHRSVSADNHRFYHDPVSADYDRVEHRRVLDRLGAGGDLDWSAAILDAAHVRAKKGDL